VTSEQINADPTDIAPDHGAESSNGPWERLDPSLAAALAPELPAMADEIIDEIGRAIPAYRRPLEGAFGRGLRIGVQEALSEFVRLAGGRGSRVPLARDIYASLGRGELRAGRGLDALQAAYRVGARVAWRRVSAAARASGADAAQVSLLAESIFAYIDEISAESVEGYAKAQAAAAGEHERRRQRLVRLLIADERPDEAALPAAAGDVGGPLPRTVAVLATSDREVERLAAQLGRDAIGARVDELGCVLVPDADGPGQRALIIRAVGSANACLGPCGALYEASASFERARQGLRLQDGGLLGDGLIVAEDHLASMLVHRDTRLLDALAQKRLAPLATLGVGPRERLAATLSAWLRCQGSVPAVAAELHLHRQTVRYRLAQLRELFGAALDDPDARFELELALRSHASGTAPGAGPLRSA
jgi:hypothetical protein